MATVMEQVRAELIAASAVTDLVGQKVSPNKAPQGTEPPFLVLSVPDDVPSNSADGMVATRLRTARVQVDAYARTYLEAQAVAAAVAEVVGNLDEPSPELSAYEEARRDLYDDEAELHRVSMDFMVSR